MGIGNNLLACVSSSKRAGITSSDFIDGARMSSLGEMVEFLEKCDKVLFLG
jgi:sulfur relay (sulfurtransferase) complex TusBCD TusD component (DsrE family)